MSMTFVLVMYIITHINIDVIKVEALIRSTFNKVAWQRSPCQGGQKENCGNWGRIVNEMKCFVQNVYEENVVKNVYQGRQGKSK